jgi:hypothetical protein
MPADIIQSTCIILLAIVSIYLLYTHSSMEKKIAEHTATIQGLLTYLNDSHSVVEKLLSVGYGDAPSSDTNVDNTPPSV